MSMETIKEIIRKGRIDDKQECYLLYEASIFGNKALTWNSLQEIIESEWKGKICMRGRHRQIKRGKVRYNLNLDEIAKEIRKWKQEGISESDIGFNQSMPDEHLLIQGELMRTFLGLSLWYTTEKVPMNMALKKQSLYAEGLKAKLLLQTNMYPSSYSDMMALLNMFPDSAVEFSAYRIPVGDMKGRNTVIWEVRNY